MNLQELKAYIKDLAEQDLSITDLQATRWIDSAIDRINTALESRIPKVKGQPEDYEPEFDERYHEALLLFANARYRESDGDFNSAGYFMSQFNDMLMDMQRDIVIPPSFKANMNIQQIVVVNASELSYNLSMPSGSYYDRIVVYLNDRELGFNEYSIDTPTRKLNMKVGLVVGDKITVEYENKSDLNQPPYQWWNF